MKLPNNIDNFMLFLSFHLYISSLCKGFIYFCFVLMFFSFLCHRYESHFNPSSVPYMVSCKCFKILPPKTSYRYEFLGGIDCSFTGSHSCNSIAVEKVTAYYMKWLYSDKKSTFLRKRLKSVKPCFTPLPNSEAGNLRKCYYISINWIKRNMHWIEILYVIV